MADTWSQQTSALSYATGIAALCILHGNQKHAVLSQPSRNRQTHIHQRSNGYILPFDDELRLARNLAFLAYAQEDPNSIPAVCVEQDRLRNRLNARIATNSGKLLLDAAIAGLQGIFDLMSLAGDADHIPTLESRIFTQIIIMCSPRILSRLGLQTRKQFKTQKPKQPFVDVLDKIAALWQFNAVGKQEMSSSNVNFVSGCRQIARQVRDWEHFRSHGKLELLVMEIYSFKTTNDLDRIINSFPHKTINPSTKASILNKVSKIARYREIARYLYRRARKDDSFRTLRAVPVAHTQSLETLPQNTVVTGASFNDLLKTSTLHPRKKEKTMRQVYNILGVTPEIANIQYESRLRKCLTGAKIHAEIKLLTFYELQSSTSTATYILMPRAVCSSKDACWLCNALIQLHGKMFTPRCHGVLYPGWKLPFIRNSPTFRDLSVRLSERLKVEVKSCVQTMLQRGARTVYPPPVESTLSALPRSLSTVHLPISDNPDRLNSRPDSLKHIISPSPPAVTHAPSAASSTMVLPTRELIDVVHLRPGEPYIYHRSSSGWASGTGFIVQASTLQLVIDIPDAHIPKHTTLCGASSNNQQDSVPRSSLIYSVTLLSEIEGASMLRQDTMTTRDVLIDADKLVEGSEILQREDESGSVYIVTTKEKERLVILRVRRQQATETENMSHD